MFIDRQVDKEAMKHIYHGILLSHKMNEALYDSTDGPRGRYAK